MTEKPNRAHSNLELKFKLLQAQQLASSRFKENIKAFRQYAPAIASQFEHYKSQQYQLRYVPQHGLTVTTSSGKSIYSDSPEVFAETQVKAHLQSPTLFSLSLLKSDVRNQNYIFAPTLNKLIEAGEGFTSKNNTLKSNKEQSLLIIAGTAIGYHIKSLLTSQKPNHIYLIEPDQDCFFACLHTVDWRAILEDYTQEGKSIHFFFNSDVSALLSSLKYFSKTHGLAHLANLQVFKHLNSPAINQLLNGLYKNYHLLATGIGFFDDEQVSLAHTAINLSNACEFLCDNIYDHNQTAIIVGNGPSLDVLIASIHQIKDKTHLFSCGTALGALYHAGITPDFHVEMERTDNIEEWIRKGTDTEYLKKITLLTLNTCPPKVTRLFKRCIMVRKPNDLGDKFLEQLPECEEIVRLDNTNPTVTNCALAYAIKLGFKEIHLAGVDLGSIYGEISHSRLSLYNEMETQRYDIRVLPPWDHSLKNSLIVEGNHLPEVFSTPILDATRFSIENLLNQHPEVKCYNPNNGAKIKYTIKADNLKLFPNNKTPIVLSTRSFNEIDTHKEISELKYHYSKLIQTVQKALSTKSLNTLISAFKNISINSDSIANQLLIGSLNSLTATAMRYSQCLSDDESTLFTTHFFELSENFLLQSNSIIQNHLLREDVTRNSAPLAEKNTKILPDHRTKPSHTWLDWKSKNLDLEGIAGPFKLRETNLIDESLKTVHTFKELGKTLNCHHHSNAIKDLLSCESIVQSIMNQCGGSPCYWQSFLYWNIIREPPVDWIHSKIFEINNAQKIKLNTNNPSYVLEIALSDLCIENAPYEYIPGSHLEIPGIERGLDTKFLDDVEYRRSAQVPQEIENSSKIIDLKKGQFIIFHSALLRRSRPWQSDTPHISLSACFVTDNTLIPERYSKNILAV